MNEAPNSISPSSLRRVVKLPEGRDLTLVDIVEIVTKHYEEYPDHGVGCACLDPLISTIRRNTTIGTISDRVADRKLMNLQFAVDHVLHMGSRWRR